jgi:alpha-tubulin suppressor-like RCC1 family protein
MRRIWITGLCLVAASVVNMVAATSADALGAAFAWGQGFHGELGNGNTINSDLPVPVSGLSGVTAISAGAQYSLALMSDGTVMAWGENSQGQLGDDGTLNSDVPVPVCEVGWSAGACPSGHYLSGVSAISAGGIHGLALLNNGTVVAWGYNLSGQLGDDGTLNSDVPVPVCEVGWSAGVCPSGHYLSGVTAIAGGGRHSLALLSNGTVVAWGDNGHEQLGDDSALNSDVPVPVCEVGWSAGACPSAHYLSTVSAISGGGAESVALLSNGTVASWGDNIQGGLGDGTTNATGVPVQVCELGWTPGSLCPPGHYLSGVSAISGGGEQSHALLSNTTVVGWGDDGGGALGNNAESATQEVPVAVCEVGWSAGACPPANYLHGVKAISGAGFVGVGLLSNGTVAVWGDGFSGELGNGTTNEVDVPVVVSDLNGVTAISGGVGQHILATAEPVPHWFKGNVELPPGGPHQNMTTKGALTFHTLGVATVCKLKDEEKIWNPLGGGAGEDEVTLFTLGSTKCGSTPQVCPPHTSTEVISKGLAWPSHLIYVAPVIRDEIEKIKLEVRCGGTYVDEFEGTLTPTVGDGVLEFGNGSGQLKDGAGNITTVTGIDKLKAPPGAITAQL